MRAQRLPPNRRPYRITRSTDRFCRVRLVSAVGVRMYRRRVTGRSWAVVGVPSSAAAHWPGLEKAPAALRAAGIVDVLRSTGLTVADDGDLPAVGWRSHRRPGSPDGGGPGVGVG